MARSLVVLVPLVLSNSRWMVRFMLGGSNFLSRLSNHLLRVLVVDLIPASLLIILVPVFELILKGGIDDFFLTVYDWLRHLQLLEFRQLLLRLIGRNSAARVLLYSRKASSASLSSASCPKKSQFLLVSKSRRETCHSNIPRTGQHSPPHQQSRVLWASLDSHGRLRCALQWCVAGRPRSSSLVPSAFAINSILCHQSR